MLVVVALMLAPCVARAGGHRAEAAETYSGLFGVGSTASGWGKSFAIPFCWVTPADDCDRNEWSFVLAQSSDLSATHDAASQKNDVDVQYLLVGVRFTFPKLTRRKDTTVRFGDVVPFGHLLVGGVRRREVGTNERFGDWGSGGAATLTGGLEFVLFSRSQKFKNGELKDQKRKDPRLDVRFRAQGALAGYGIGDKTFAGFGYAFALSVGWLVD
jgi:hypothetical protein